MLLFLALQEIPMPVKPIDLNGKVFGPWTVVRVATKEERDSVELSGSYACWLCRCECGTEKVWPSNYLTKKGIKAKCIACGIDKDGERWPTTCETCGGPIVENRPEKARCYCSEECRVAGKKAKMSRRARESYERKIPPDRVASHCSECGNAIVGKNSQAKTCSAECASKRSARLDAESGRLKSEVRKRAKADAVSAVSKVADECIRSISGLTVKDSLRVLRAIKKSIAERTGTVPESTQETK